VGDQRPAVRPPEGSALTVAALVLAGGRGRRLGQRKASVVLGGRTLLERAVARAQEVCDEVLISGPAELALPGVPAVADDQDGVGPLAGVLAGLTAARAAAVIVIPCDSPFVPVAFLRGLSGLADSADVIVPLTNGFWEPLHGIYSKACAEPIRRLIDEGERRIRMLYDEVRVLAVGPEIYAKWDPEGLAFFNINTPEELLRAEELVARGAG